MTPKQQQRLSRVVWFEIPALDFDRAIRFYETIFEIKLNRQQFGPTELAVFTYEAPGIGGCLLPVAELQPATHASLYMNAEPSFDAVRGGSGGWKRSAAAYRTAARHGVLRENSRHGGERHRHPRGKLGAMRRADRLFRIAQYIRSRRLTTPGQLAQWLEVSERTTASFRTRLVNPLRFAPGWS